MGALDESVALRAQRITGLPEWLELVVWMVTHNPSCGFVPGRTIYINDIIRTSTLQSMSSESFEDPEVLFESR